MTKTPFRKIRKTLLQSCDDCVKRFHEAESFFSKGYAHTIVEDAIGPNLTGISSSSEAIPIPVTKTPTGLPELFVSYHAILIQEWFIYLDSVFGAALLHCLKKHTVSRLPNMDLRLDKLELTNMIDLRKSICSKLEEPFSFRPYPEKIKLLLTMFAVTIDHTLQYKMKTHVTVRNIFQHNRGIIRQRDLDEIGRPNGYFELLDHNGSKQEYALQDKITLSKSDIDDLNETIKK